jgi:hypothetical protein
MSDYLNDEIESEIDTMNESIVGTYKADLEDLLSRIEDEANRNQERAKVAYDKLAVESSDYAASRLNTQAGMYRNFSTELRAILAEFGRSDV